MFGSIFGGGKSKPTCPFNPKVELDTRAGGKRYIRMLEEMNESEIYTELSNVRAAKHNQMMMPSGIKEYGKKQALVSDLNDKALAILCQQFGPAKVMQACAGDLRLLNTALDQLDDAVASRQLPPEHHGRELLMLMDGFINR